MTAIRTSDVVVALRKSYDSEVRKLAGTGGVVSKSEAATIATADVRGAVTSIADGQPGVRLTVDRVVDEAVNRALQRMGAVNTKGAGFFSLAEIDVLVKAQPDLGKRVRAAYDQVKASPVPPPPAALVADLQAALGPLANGKLPSNDVRLVRETKSSRVIELDLFRNDGPTVTARVSLAKSTPKLQSVELVRDAAPVTGPTVAALAAALGAGARVLGFVEQVDAASGKSSYLVAADSPKARLSRVELGTPAKVSPATLSPADEAVARTLALQAAKGAAFTLVSNSGEDAPKLEYHLRTAALKPSSLEQTTDPADSAVGFDPATELFQFRLSSVWGDNAAFVTFAKDGTVRVETAN